MTTLRSLRRRRQAAREGERAGVMITVVILLVVLLGGGTGAFRMVAMNCRAARHERMRTYSFNMADAGVEYVRTCFLRDVRLNRVDPAADEVPVVYTPPQDYTFDAVTSLTPIAPQIYLYVVTGRCASVSCAIQAVVEVRTVGVSMGIFGDVLTEISPGVSVLSYDSRVVVEPTELDSTGEQGVGSNDLVKIQSVDSVPEGTVTLGADPDGVPAEFTLEGDPFLVADVVRLSRLNPDPLGVRDGTYETLFGEVRGSNDNRNALIDGAEPANPGEPLTLSGDVVLTSGRYHVEEIELKSKDTLTILADDGPVEIFLEGGGRAATHTEIHVVPPLPTNFRVYSRGDAEIRFQPASEFVGLVYAPYADVLLQPRSSCYGAVWGRTATLRPGGHFFQDMALLELLSVKDVRLRSWKEL